MWKFIGCGTCCYEGYWSLLVWLVVVEYLVVFYSLCKRKSVARVMYWSIKINKRGILLAGALFCIWWSYPLVLVPFGVGRLEILLPRYEMRIFQGFDFQLRTEIVPTIAVVPISVSCIE
jgi:hypothetical protein